MMNRNNENRTVTIARQVIATIAALFLLSLFLSVRGAVAEDLNIDLQRLAMLFVRYTELILPLGREYRRPAGFRFSAFFHNPLIYFRSCQVKHK